MSKGLKTLMDKLKIEGKVCMVGSSMGGYMTQHFIQTYPEKVSKAILANTFYPSKYYLKANFFKLLLLPIMPDCVVRNLLSKSVVGPVWIESGKSKLLQQFLKYNVSIATRKQMQSRLNILTTVFKVEKKENIKIMILETEPDPLVPDQLRAEIKKKYQELGWDPKIKTFKSCGHFEYLAPKAEEYCKTVFDFFEEEVEEVNIEV